MYIVIEQRNCAFSW